MNYNLSPVCSGGLGEMISGLNIKLVYLISRLDKDARIDFKRNQPYIFNQKTNTFGLILKIDDANYPIFSYLPVFYIKDNGEIRYGLYHIQEDIYEYEFEIYNEFITKFKIHNIITHIENIKNAKNKTSEEKTKEINDALLIKVELIKEEYIKEKKN